MEEHAEARAIIETLNRAGFIAFYAGGWVRDFLLRRPSDDIDIATNAPPETIQALFPHTVPIGISFGILLVIQDGRPYEVATFRQDFDYQDGRRPERVVFSTAPEDAKRRDFTINGLFYDPIRQEILDYVNGRADIQAGIIRAIGNPHERIKEDRLRMIRAIRLACRFGFTIESKTAAAIRFHASELMPAVAIERIVQEFEKGLAFGTIQAMLLMLHEYGLLGSVFPELRHMTMADIQRSLEPLSYYPQDAPIVVFLLALFPHYSLEQQLAFSKRLKRSNRDLHVVSVLHQLQDVIRCELTASRLVENVEWAHLFAQDFCEMAMPIVFAHYPREQAEAFLFEQKQRRDSLQTAIERIKKQTPLLTAKDLMQVGITPGKEMGILLKEAERIACNEQIDDPALVLQHLQKSPFWPRMMH